MNNVTKKPSLAANGALSNEQMWEIYAQGIAQAAGYPSSPADFILAGNSLVANLASFSNALPSGAVPTVPQALAQVYNLANTELSEQGIYTPSMSHFFSDYATYIDGLTPEGDGPTPAQEAQIRLLQVDLENANNLYNDNFEKAVASWRMQSEVLPDKYPTFQSFLDQTSWGQTLNTNTSNISGINSQMNALLNDIYGARYLAISVNKQVVNTTRTDQQGTDASRPAVMEINTDAGNRVVPRYDPSSLSTFSSWVDSTISQHGNASPITIDFTENASRFDFSKSSYFSNTSWKNNHFFYSSKGGSTSSGTKVNVNTASSNFKCTLMFDSITQVQLAAGSWYDSSLMYDWKNPNNLSIPTYLIVGMFPSIELEMDAQSYASAYSAFNSSSGFGVGSFWSSASHAQGKSKLGMQSEWNQSKNSVKISGSSILPVILGMRVAKPTSTGEAFEKLAHSQFTIG